MGRLWSMMHPGNPHQHGFPKGPPFNNRTREALMDDDPPKKGQSILKPVAGERPLAVKMGHAIQTYSKILRENAWYVCCFEEPTN